MRDITDMNNWIVTIVNTVQPFEVKKVVVPAETVVEALDEWFHGHIGFVARSASFHSTCRGGDICQILPEI